jgi:hypothetical protein
VLLACAGFTGDPNNLEMSTTDYNTMVFSYGSGLDFAYHTNRGGVKLQLGSGCTTVAVTASQSAAGLHACNVRGQHR